MNKSLQASLADTAAKLERAGQEHHALQHTVDELREANRCPS